MARKLGGKQLSGINPLAYLGVEPSSPSNFLIITRAPTINDVGHNVGTIWLYEKNDSTVTNDVYMLVDIDNALTSSTTPQGPARWVMLGAGSGEIVTLTGDSGGAITPDGAGNITLAGGTNIATVGTANTITIEFDGPITVGDGGTGVSSFLANSVIIGDGANALDTTNVGTDGQVLIGATGADPAFATITSTGSTVLFTLGANTLNLETAASVPTSFLADDTNSAVPAAGVLTVAGGSGIATSASGSTLTITADTTTQTFAVTALDNTDSPYTVLTTDQYMTCDVSANVLSILLPDTTTTGRTWTIKDAGGDASTFNITVTSVSGVVLIDGATTFVMNTDYESVNVIWTGSAYEVW